MSDTATEQKATVPYLDLALTLPSPTIRAIAEAADKRGFFHGHDIAHILAIWASYRSKFTTHTPHGEMMEWDYPQGGHARVHRVGSHWIVLCDTAYGLHAVSVYTADDGLVANEVFQDRDAARRRANEVYKEHTP